MKLPQPIKVGSVIFPFVWAEKIEIDGRKMIGACTLYPAKIEIDPSLQSHPVQLVDTVMHELTHAISFNFGLAKEKYTQEEIAILIGSGLTTVFLDNPHFIKWIKDALH